MIKELRLILKNNISLESRQEDKLVFKLYDKKIINFEANDKELADFICFFTNHGSTESELNANLNKINNKNSKGRALRFLEESLKNNLINYEINFSSDEKIVLSPYNYLPKIFRIDNCLTKKYRLSRFSYFLKSDLGLTLINPLAEFYLTIYGFNILNLLFAILDDRFHNNDDNNSKEFINSFLSILLIGGFINDENYREPDILKSWEFHDLVFHHNSRLGKSRDKHFFGATYRFKNSEFKFSSEKRENLINEIKLYRPDVNKKQKIFFYEILEQRRSLRNYSKYPINLQEIGEFLYRSVATRQIIESKPYNLALKPFPSSGGVHELEFYLVSNLSKDLPKGIYYYNSDSHTLSEVFQSKEYIPQIIKTAQSAWGEANSPQILIILTSKFQKMAWKYEGMAYRNTLINVGAVFQTMYLVATAMNLAPCALGFGNSDLFSRALNLNALEEGSVGEFALGTKI